MTLLLLAQPLLEQVAQLVEVERLQGLALLRGQALALARILEPRSQLVRQRQRVGLDALEVGQERLVEGVVLGDVLDAQRPRQLVEPVERRLVEPERHGLHQGHPLVRRHLQLVPAQLEQEVDEHRSSVQALARRLTSSTSDSVLSRVPRNGMPPPTRERSTPARFRAQIQSTSSLVDGRLRSRGSARSP